MKGGLGNIMKQAQAMQKNMKKVQEELAGLEVTGSAGGGLVNVLMTCRNEVRKITIDPELFSDDKDIVEDLVAVAMNDAIKKAEKTSEERMSAVTGGMPSMPGMPF